MESEYELGTTFVHFLQWTCPTFWTMVEQTWTGESALVLTTFEL